MKKLTHTLALSTILLGALSPTGQAIADTVPTTDATHLSTDPTTPSPSESTTEVSQTTTSQSSSQPGDEKTIPSSSSTTTTEAPLKTSDTQKNQSTEAEKSQNVSVSDIIGPTQEVVPTAAEETPGAALVVKGLQNAAVTDLTALEAPFWTKKDWTILQEGALRSVGNTTELAIIGKVNSQSRFVAFGSFYLGFVDSSNKINSVFPVFNLAESDVPTKDELAEMDNTERASYRLSGRIPSGWTTKGLIVDGDGSTSRLVSLGEGGFKEKPTLPLSSLTAYSLDSSSGSISTYTLNHSFTGTGEAEGIYIDSASRMGMTVANGSFSNSISHYRKLVDGIPNFYVNGENDSRIVNPTELVEGSTSDSVTWQVEPDLSTPIMDGSAVIKIHDATLNSNTYLRVPYNVIAAEGQNISVEYRDEEGAQIADPKTISGAGTQAGVTAYDATTPEYKQTIAGYTLDETKLPANGQGTFTDQEQTVTYTYKKDPIPAEPVAVKYVDENNQSIPGYDTTITGNDGDVVSTDPYKISIPTYTLDDTKLPAANVTLSTSAQDPIVFVYKKNQGTVKIQYQDETGTSISDEQTITGDEGVEYDTTSNQIKIPGYYLDTDNLPPNVAGFYNSGTQTVTYKYKVDQTAVNVHDSTIYVGDSWKAEDNFDSALDKDGNAVSFSQLTVDDSKVDTSKAGTYDVTYTYDGVTSIAKITVLSNKSAITVHDSTLTVGDSWTAKDNFDSALNKKGDKVPFDAITVDGTVDTSKAGVYKVTYSYKEAKGEVELFDAQVGDTQQGTNTVIATITVKDKAPVDPGNPTEPTAPTNPSTPTNPSNPTLPSSPNSPSQTGNGQGNGNNSINQTAVSSNESLPQTGEKAGLNLVATGAALLMALIGLLLFRKPKKSSDE